MSWTRMVKQVKLHLPGTWRRVAIFIVFRQTFYGEITPIRIDYGEGIASALGFIGIHNIKNPKIRFASCIYCPFHLYLFTIRHSVPHQTHIQWQYLSFLSYYSFLCFKQNGNNVHILNSNLESYIRDLTDYRHTPENSRQKLTNSFVWHFTNPQWKLKFIKTRQK